MDNEKVPAAMQDNVTQSDVTEADKAAVTAFHNKQAARILAGDKTLGDNRDCIEQAFAAHRLASTAQPEVKALVEALEGFVNDLTSGGRNPSRTITMNHFKLNARIEDARQALAAYHEAQP